MSIPLPTTTISVLRAPASSDSSHDPWGRQDQAWSAGTAFVPVIREVRAVISATSGRQSGQADGQVVDLVLKCDPVAATQTDKILDETTQKTYDIIYVFDAPNFMGTGHTEIGLSFNSEASA